MFSVNGSFLLTVAYIAHNEPLGSCATVNRCVCVFSLSLYIYIYLRIHLAPNWLPTWIFF